MQTTLQVQFKKLIVSATDPKVVVNSLKTSPRLFITDRLSGKKFLIDTGADLSLVSSYSFTKLKFKKSAPTLYAANDLQIQTYGTTRQTLDLGIHKNMEWNFIVAKTKHNIIGADFFEHFDLLIDVKNSRLIDPQTKRFSNCFSVESCSFPTIRTFDTSCQYSDLLSEFSDITQINKISSPSSLTSVEHIIETNGPPVTAKPRRLCDEKLKAAKEEFAFLMNLGICRPSKSPYSSPLHMVLKANGTWRPCGDYRSLNAQTIPDKYPLPHIQDLSSIMHGKRIFTKIDLNRAYNQIPIRQCDIPKTAISTPFGLYEFTHMTFGLCNAAQTFQRYMHEVLRGLDFTFCYLDDICIASSTPDEHLTHLRMVFERLRNFKLTINPSKCEFGKEEIVFLGHVVNQNGISPNPQKVAAVQNFPLPKHAFELKRFLNMINFYRRFIRNPIAHQLPLNNLINGNKKKDKTLIQWTPDTIKHFEACKEALVNASLLAHPKAGADIVLCTDASDIAVGAVLHQIVNNKPQPLGFFSKKLTDAQTKYSAYDRELLAIYLAIKHFRYALEGRNFEIWTDHKPITFAFTKKHDSSSPRQIRQLDFIGQFSTRILHVPGETNITADTLSRINALQLKEQNIDYQFIATEQKVCPELKEYLESSTTSLKIKPIRLPNSNLSVFCDFSTSSARPFIPKSCREAVITKIHNIAHTGVRSTLNSIRQRFVWPRMQKDVASYVKSCIVCQRSKVSRHTTAPLASYSLPSQRFEHINIDIVGPLPPSNGYRYCLTIIDRYTRWPEAIPLKDINSETIAQALIKEWISRFGVPKRISTDQGTQFKSILFNDLSRLLGIHHLQTTAYHPQANGIVERWHRTLKSSLMCYNTKDWTAVLPLILLGLRTTLKPDLSTSPAEIVYGTTLKLPGEFLVDSKFIPQSDFVKRLSRNMDLIRPVETSHHTIRKPFIHPKLNDATHVFVRKEGIKTSLNPPYNGPFMVLQRHNKHFQVNVNGKLQNISIDRLKPAFLPITID